MTLPRRRSKPRMGIRESSVIRCSGHRAFIRSFECALATSAFAKHCDGETECAHVRTGTDGGTGMKPSDCWTIPLCRGHHREQHNIGEPAFEKRYAIRMKAMAEQLWNISPAGKRYRRDRMMDAVPSDQRSEPKR